MFQTGDLNNKFNVVMETIFFFITISSKKFLFLFFILLFIFIYFLYFLFFFYFLFLFFYIFVFLFFYFFIFYFYFLFFLFFQKTLLISNINNQTKMLHPFSAPTLRLSRSSVYWRKLSTTSKWRRRKYSPRTSN